MTPVLFVIIPALYWPAILVADGPVTVNNPNATNRIQNVLAYGASVQSCMYYITANLTVPANAVYACRLNSDGTYTVVLPKQAALTKPLVSYLGWPISS